MAEVPEMITTAHFLSGLGDASRVLSRLAVALQRQTDVRAVLTRCDIASGEAPGVEWYVDAELVNGEAVSRRLNLYFVGGAWRVEADVSRITQNGHDVVHALEGQSATDAQVGPVLMQVATELASIDLR
jgi:hypothetical protein